LRAAVVSQRTVPGLSAYVTTEGARPQVAYAWY
jgi:hypothetical protein